MSYDKFLKSKINKVENVGKDIDIADIHPMIFDFQRDIISWATRKGRAAIFLDTGMGKTFIQIEWARLLGENTLIIAPLSVARQTVRESKKINVDVEYVRSQEECTGDNKLWITNYEMIDKFDFSKFGAVVLDESSILKAIGGKTKRRLINLCQKVPYRLACTATPAPNDNIEIGNHAEFLGICTYAEMLAMFFVNANKEHTFIVDNKVFRKKGTNKGGQEWRLKHHGEDPFFSWLSSWAIAMTKPSDLGYNDDGFILPALNIKTHFVTVDYKPDGLLFFMGMKGIGDRAQIRANTVIKRLDILKNIVNESPDQWIVWTGLQTESSLATKELNDAVEVKGSDSIEKKSKAFEDFQDGLIRVLVTKGRIGGFGMNFQNAHNMVFFGMNDSWELWYQCIRREWRFGQTYPVNVHVILSDIESEIYRNIQRKDAMASRLRTNLINRIKSYEKGEIKMEITAKSKYDEGTDTGDGYKIMMGDSCKRLGEVGSETVDMTVYSPPFEDLYTYTDSPRDLGNCRSAKEFYRHYHYIIREIFRVTKPGRLSCVHVSDVPAMFNRDGYIGAKDFPGKVIRSHEKDGWIFFGRAYIQKNPQAQAIRTKAKGLLFVQMRKDSAASRPALVDQILIFKKPGENQVPIRPVENGDLDNEKWISWAHGIWTDIRESDTLRKAAAREADDEKHICPLQLGTIERCIKLYSNPGETVLSPFMGIGSEIVQALKFGRKGIGIELKPSYYKQAKKNIEMTVAESQKLDLFSGK